MEAAIVGTEWQSLAAAEAAIVGTEFGRLKELQVSAVFG